MGTADGAMGGSYGAREFGAGEWAGAHWRRSGGSHWSAFEIIAMVLGFIVFWPIGLAILGYKFWQRRYGGPDAEEGCPYASRCPFARPRCSEEAPILEAKGGGTRKVACHFPLD